MCFDGENPTFATREMPRARKPHKCCECGNTIEPSERYERVSGKWGEYLDTYCTCLSCVALRAKVEQIERAHGCNSMEATPPFCELIEAAYEYGLFPNTKGR